MHFFRVHIYTGRLSANEFKVELYANPLTGGGPAIESMSAYKDADPMGQQPFLGEVCACRSAGDYTARIVPYHVSAAVPLEAGQILWQR